MKRAELIFCLTMSVISLSCTAEKEQPPPSMATIFATVNDKWSKKNYRYVKRYIERLKVAYCGYVPVKLIEMTEAYKFGGQVEKSIIKIEELSLCLDNNEFFVSPIFIDLLKSRKDRYASLANFYKQRGITKESRAKNENPLLMTSFQHSKKWGDEVLYFNAPEIFITTNGMVEVVPDDDFKLAKEALVMSEKEILLQVSLQKSCILTKKYLVKELVKRRAESDDVNEMLKGLTEGAMVYTYGETVKIMAKDGQRYIPSILMLLDGPSRYSDNKECYIWALMRMKATDERVLAALENISTGMKDRHPVKDYAKRTLEYLHGLKLTQNTNK